MCTVCERPPWIFHKWVPSVVFRQRWQERNAVAAGELSRRMQEAQEAAMLSAEKVKPPAHDLKNPQLTRPAMPNNQAVAVEREELLQLRLTLERRKANAFARFARCRFFKRVIFNQGKSLDLPVPPLPKRIWICCCRNHREIAWFQSSVPGSLPLSQSAAPLTSPGTSCRSRDLVSSSSLTRSDDAGWQRKQLQRCIHCVRTG